MSSSETNIYDAQQDTSGVWRVDLEKGPLNKPYYPIHEVTNPVSRLRRRFTSPAAVLYVAAYTSLVGLETLVYASPIIKMVETISSTNYDPIFIVHGIAMSGFAITAPIMLEKMVLPFIDNITAKLERNLWEEKQKELGLR